MTDHASGLARTAQILHFLLKYRRAGVFTGLDLDAATLDPGTMPDTEGKPEQFVDDLEALGPTFIKVGQALSTRPDMVPAPYLVALERMQDDVVPVPFAAIREVVEDALGVRISKAFAHFDEVPLGSASLAQVHRATLRDGRMVAVKVQRPGIVDVVRADLDALAGLAGKADRMTDLGRRVHFADWVHEFRKTLLAELDYHAEAENLVRFVTQVLHRAGLVRLRADNRVVDVERAHQVAGGLAVLETEDVADLVGDLVPHAGERHRFTVQVDRSDLQVGLEDAGLNFRAVRLERALPIGVAGDGFLAHHHAVLEVDDHVRLARVGDLAEGDRVIQRLLPRVERAG